MNKSVILAGFFLAFGFLFLLLGLLGYTFVSAISWPVLSILICVIIVFLTVKGVKCKTERPRLSVAAAACLPLFALFFVATKRIAADISLFSLVLLFWVSAICAMKSFFSHVRNIKVIKPLLSILYIIILLPMFWLSFWIAFFGLLIGDFGSVEVTSAEISPNAVHIAEVVSSDQGALGGSTRISVTEKNRDINILIGELRRTPLTIYHGSWWEHHYMSLCWESDDNLYVYTRDGTMRFYRQNRNWVRY